MSKKTRVMPSASEQALLAEIKVEPITDQAARKRFQRLLEKHHYLGGLQAVGEQIYYVAINAQGHWLALLLFSAAAKHLKHRDRWIGWSHTQCDRRLPLIANNSRFLILPEFSVPNLGSRVLHLALDRLSADWQAKYGHPILVVETFVDPGQFCGTVYTANNWVELGLTDGWGRCQRDYYVAHNRPKQLCVRELRQNARRSLQAEHLAPALAAVVQARTPLCAYKVKAIRAISEHFQAVPDYREYFESYPLWSLLTLMLLAVLCEAPRGQTELAKFARRLSQAQRRALGIRRNRQGHYPVPCQSTFSRMLAALDGAKINAALLEIQAQVRGAPPAEDLVAIDGKEPKHGPGHSILSAVTVPSQHYLGSALVDTKTNEIPVARELFAHLDLKDRWVLLDALHTQSDTARALVLDHGADYLLTVKDNQQLVPPLAQPPAQAAAPHLHPFPGHLKRKPPR